MEFHDEASEAGVNVDLDRGARPSARPSSIGALVFALVVLGIVMLVEGLTGSDDADPSAAVDPVPSTVATSLPVATAPTTEPAADPQAWPAEDPSAPVLAPLRSAVAMPPTSQFAGVAVRVEPTVDLSNLTGMIWNHRLGSYYATTQDGVVHRVDRELTRSEAVLDLRSEVTPIQSGSERGLRCLR